MLSEIQSGSNVFSVIADESRDCSNKEQMPIIIRYVNENREIQESFMAFVECNQGNTREQVATLIQRTCQTLGLDFSLCRGQGYDGAGNMAGVTKGAAQIIRSTYPKAFYFHCASHKLNLCIAHSCKLSSVTNMMDAITCLPNFLNYSPRRQKSLESHVMNYPDSVKTKLVPLCRTWWVERLDALDVTLDLSEAVVETFIDMAQNVDKQWNTDTVAQASALLKRIDFEFLINLVINHTNFFRIHKLNHHWIASTWN